MSLSYTGKLFRRIAICGGAVYGRPHKVWEHTFLSKYHDDYHSDREYIYSRAYDGRWRSTARTLDDREFEYWKALKWLQAEGLVEVRTGHIKYGTYRTLSYKADYIVLTSKGLELAHKYINQKED